MSRIQKNGMVALYLLVIINRETKLIPLDLHWPAEFVDNKNGKIYPRTKKDIDYNDYLLIINVEIQKINEVFKIYRIQDKILDMANFLFEITHTDRRKAFTVFMELQLEQRYKYGVIAKSTYTAGKGTVKLMRKYLNGELPFHGLTTAFFQGFSKYLKNKPRCNSMGTIWTRIKDIKTYIHLAEEESFSIPNDYRKFLNRTAGSSIIYLEESELTQLVELYNSRRLIDVDHNVLRAFLFSCFCSIRISDVQRANWEWVTIDKTMKFIPHKGRRFRKEVEIPLSEMALSLIEKQKGMFLNLPTDQEINRTLKSIATAAKIKKNLTFHVSRHTFGTHYYRQTKDVITLQKIMGHSKIQTTMVYVHVNESDKRTGIDAMSNFFTQKPIYMRVVS